MRDQSLFQFLRSALQIHLRFVSGALPRAEAPIYVIGNPSADLDSIISTLIYSYFASNRVPRDQPRPHVPLINLAAVPSGPELRRLRPEFAKGLWLSTHSSSSGNENPWKDGSENATSSVLHDHFLTVADFAEHLKQASWGTERRLSADAVLVDWNALPTRTDSPQGKGSITGLSNVEFTVLGCIDHHADENFLPPIASTQPHLVQPAGSCTSLVIKTLQDLDLWQAHSETQPQATEEENQIARLSLIPILIDTANLTAKDKVTDSDTKAHSFLLPKISQSQSQAQSQSIPWDQNTFYTAIQTTKQNSLDLLTVHEMLDRDYKQWTEQPSSSSSSSPLQIGICSMVRSIPWIIRKAGSSDSFLESLKTFAGERDLDIVVVMTAFSAPPKEKDDKDQDQFCRELLVCAPKGNQAVEALEAFISASGSQLGLEEWRPLDGDNYASGASLGIMEGLVEGTQGNLLWRRMWVQTNVAKSRKQVAPLIRGAVASL